MEETSENTVNKRETSENAVNKPLTYQLRLKLFKEDKFFGPGIASLLRYVDEYKSLNKAAAHMNMAYSKAWKIIRHAEGELGFTLLERKIGGTGGGGACVTREGRLFLEKYERFAKETQNVADEIFKKYFG